MNVSSAKVNDKKNTGPLSGLRILDLSRILAGPTCTQLLGDYGADIIKVEKPGLGDDTRAWGPPYAKDENNKDMAESAYYLSSNRNKRSITLDISTKDGLKRLKSVLDHCDVLIENFKVGSLAKYGLDYETLSYEFPELIYCSITGFGQTGPNAHRPGYDLLAQAFGGIMSITGTPQGEPMKVGVGIADVVCGLYSCTAILAALQHRNLTREGQHIDISLIDTQIAWLINAGTNYLISGQEPNRLGNQHPNIVPYQVFEVTDGHVIIAVGNDDQFIRFCQIIGRTDISKNEKYNTNRKRVDNREALIPILSSEIKKFSKNSLVEKMDEHKIPGGSINNLAEVFGSSQVKARNMKITMEDKRFKNGAIDLIGNPVKFSKTPVTYRFTPPTCGEHNNEIAHEINTAVKNKSAKE